MPNEWVGRQADWDTKLKQVQPRIDGVLSGISGEKSQVYIDFGMDILDRVLVGPTSAPRFSTRQEATRTLFAQLCQEFEEMQATPEEGAYWMAVLARLQIAVGTEELGEKLWYQAPEVVSEAVARRGLQAT